MTDQWSARNEGIDCRDYSRELSGAGYFIPNKPKIILNEASPDLDGPEKRVGVDHSIPMWSPCRSLMQQSSFN